MKLKRMTMKKDHLVSEGTPIVNHHAFDDEIIISMDGVNGECHTHYNRLNINHSESMFIALRILKLVAKRKLDLLINKVRSKFK